MTDKIDAVSVFKALGDSSRLSILRILMEGESYVELIASRLSLTSATVSHHLKKLESAGLVECHRTQFYMIYSIKSELLSRTIADTIGSLPAPAGEDAYEQGVIDSFFEYGRLKSLPAQRKKREIVLRYILDALETGVPYTEEEINEHIKKFHGDYCTLRREMISCGLMKREMAGAGKRDVYKKA